MQQVDFPVACKQPNVDEQINWSLCFICQCYKLHEELVCPAESKRKDVGAGYLTAAKDLSNFYNYGGVLPDSLRLRIECLNNGSAGIESILVSHRAKWHKSCRDNYNNTKLSRIKRRSPLSCSDSTLGDPVPVAKRTRSELEQNGSKDSCFFCNEGASVGELHKAHTFTLDARVRSSAELLQDNNLIRKLSEGGMIALEAKYHAKCLTHLYNRVHSAMKSESHADYSVSVFESIALSEVITHLENSRMEMVENLETPLLKLSDVTKVYHEKLQQFGIQINSRIHSTRLKEKLMANIPGLTAHKQGKEVLLIFKEDIGSALSISNDQSDEKALCLAQAAKIIREDILSSENKTVFGGKFHIGCERDSVPCTLVALVRMILHGPTVKDADEDACQAALSISQLIKFNIKKNTPRVSASSVHVTHHAAELETPLPVYISLLIHGCTRNKTIIDKLYQLGICISYDRFLRLSSDLANAVCQYYIEKEVVCPPELKGGLFTTAAVDNIDYNPSSTTASGSFHGTGISLFQHPCNEDREEISDELEKLNLLKSSEKSVYPLPAFYTTVPPISQCNSVVVPESVKQASVLLKIIEEAQNQEFEWLDHARAQCLNSTGSLESVTWSAYHAERITHITKQCSSTLLPLFEDSAHSLAMVRHSMKIVQNAVNFINPDQIPVLACDQLLFAIAKEIQWAWPEDLGEIISL